MPQDAFEVMMDIRTAGDPKRARILEGAMKVFLAYGFTRATMDDIARAAEVSRPALYLLFKNKTDIYRAIGAAFLENSVETARVRLEGEGDFPERMMAAIGDALIDMMARIAQSQHGEELLDMKNSLAADLIQTWREGLGAHVASAITREAESEGVDLAARGVTAAMLADLLLDGLEGMKMRTSGVEEQRKAARGLVRVIELAIRA
jgi:AcrR family transcriptional regulator